MSKNKISKNTEVVNVVPENIENAKLAAVRDIPDLAALEHATTAAKIITGLLPVVGNTISEILSKNTSLIVSAREKNWKEAVIAAFEELFQKAEGRLNPEEFFKDDRLVTALLNSVQIATRTHQQEKLDALKNAVLNSALPDAPTDTKQAIFLGLIDDLTPLHIIQLKTHMEPSFPRIIPKTEGEKYLVRARENNADPDGLLRYVKKDLFSKGLLTEFEANIGIRTEITPVALEFLEFITSPLEPPPPAPGSDLGEHSGQVS